jgi:peptidoglycan/xylan/chitin deacetylase (PgdA/CDA1 family)/SAM-dependent methyltransferase
MLEIHPSRNKAANPPNEALENHFDAVFATPDPWSYEDLYEQTKRQYTLEMLPDTRPESALEIGCAEGHLTEQLSGRVASLLAVDISQAALGRARDRCHAKRNVSFLHADVFSAIPSGRFDLIICSEILYYTKNRFELRRLCRGLVDRLQDQGYLLLVHANLVSDDRTVTGFDFHEIGTLFVARTIGRTGPLEFIRELRTELYRIQLFRKNQQLRGHPRLPREVVVRDAKYADADKVVGLIKWGGCLITSAEATHLWTSPEIPILMYHRISATGPDGLRPYRVDPAQFERQLAYLQRHGYESIDLTHAYELITGSHSVPAGRLVAFTFDDAYKDFYQCALPLLRRYGFSATVFVPVQHIGERAAWDSSYGEPAEIMSWDELRRSAQLGTAFGSHGTSHTRLTQLDEGALTRELVESRDVLRTELGAEVLSLSYPFSDLNDTVRERVEKCGYRLAVAGVGRLNPRSARFAVPRQEIVGQDDLETFVRKLGTPKRGSRSAWLRYQILHLIRDRRTYMSF